ncbi:hypothetical protein M8J76_001153 [Diaphorina citri]|nr:hypothetical protein M8J75_014109 [Diaphorina citri]KAI5718851.1 hypothetical protein M8J76_001153 [Diaphorina citri]
MKKVDYTRYRRVLEENRKLKDRLRELSGGDNSNGRISAGCKICGIAFGACSHVAMAPDGHIAGNVAASSGSNAANFTTS